MTTLNTLELGQSATIRDVAARPRSLRRRLLEMGLLPGTHVTLVRRAPLGDPLELRLRDYTLSMRSADAASVTIVPVEADRACPAAAAEPALETAAAE